MGTKDSRSDRERLTGFISGVRLTNDRTLRQSMKRKTMLLIGIVDLGEYIIVLMELQEMRRHFVKS